jgi:hypothetical protein
MNILKAWVYVAAAVQGALVQNDSKDNSPALIGYTSNNGPRYAQNAWPIAGKRSKRDILDVYLAQKKIENEKIEAEDRKEGACVGVVTASYVADLKKSREPLSGFTQFDEATLGNLLSNLTQCAYFAKGRPPSSEFQLAFKPSKSQQALLNMFYALFRNATTHELANVKEPNSGERWTIYLESHTPLTLEELTAGHKKVTQYLVDAAVKNQDGTINEKLTWDKWSSAYKDPNSRKAFLDSMTKEDPNHTVRNVFLILAGVLIVGGIGSGGYLLYQKALKPCRGKRIASRQQRRRTPATNDASQQPPLLAFERELRQPTYRFKQGPAGTPALP